MVIKIFVQQNTYVWLFLAARAIFQLSGGCHQAAILDLCYALMAFRVRVLFRATPTATQDLGFYGLIRKTGTRVPQWDSNLRHKDYQIFVPPIKPLRHAND
jgi:hypothetical protein